MHAIACLVTDQIKSYTKTVKSVNVAANVNQCFIHLLIIVRSFIQSNIGVKACFLFVQHDGGKEKEGKEIR